jgi:hypothetical protein
VLDISNTSRAYHTRHGHHVNRGKEVKSILLKKYIKIMANSKYISSDIIVLDFSNKEK